MMSGESHLSLKFLEKIWPKLESVLGNRYYGENEAIHKYINECIQSVKTECPEDYASSDLRNAVLSCFGEEEEEEREDMKEEEEACDSVEEEMKSECIHCEAADDEQCP